MRKVSMATRTELVEAIGERYRSADRRSKGRVLDEFVAVTGFHRKHAMRLLRAGRSMTVAGVRLERRIYDEAARAALVVLWEAADRLCGKRLRPLIPILLDSMERHGHLDLAPDVTAQLTKMSAATIDRALREVKSGGRAPRRRGIAGTALRQSVPIRTFDDWGDPAPGYIEADLVS
ncbi:MAG: ISNCY family transposase, partial [Chromatocurvus sp.]